MRFSASNTRFVIVVKQIAVMLASAHQRFDRVGPNAPAGRKMPNPPPPYIAVKYNARPTVMRKKNTIARMPMRPPEIALDLERQERNRQPAHAHRDHRKSSASEIRIVTRSIPPSRKLVAMN